MDMLAPDLGELLFTASREGGMKEELYLCVISSTGTETLRSIQLRRTVLQLQLVKQMQSETDAAVMLHKNPFAHNKSLNFCNSEEHPKNTLWKMWNLRLYSTAKCHPPSFSPTTTFLLLRGLSLVAVVMEECHISL